MTAALWPDHLFMVGCGNMAGQMLKQWLDGGLDPSRLVVLRPSGQPVFGGVRVTAEWPASLPEGTTVLLGMKPYQLAEVADRLAPLVSGDMRLISILAGAPLAELRRLFPEVRDIVRAMPNLPVGIGQGVTALYADSLVSNNTRNLINNMIGRLGLAEWLGDEALFNAVTALSGCGPAFVFRFVDALARAGEAIGLPADQSARMALATVQGSANMAAFGAESPAIMADRVASPGGMTRQGLNVLDADERLMKLLTDTLTAARDRGDEMARGG